MQSKVGAKGSHVMTKSYGGGDGRASGSYTALTY